MLTLRDDDNRSLRVTALGPDYLCVAIMDLGEHLCTAALTRHSATLMSAYLQNWLESRPAHA